MKIKIKVPLLIATLSVFLYSFEPKNQNTDYVYITGSRFTYPLFEKWISEYQKLYPLSNIKLIKRGLNLNTDSVNLTIISRKLTNDDLNEKNIHIQVGRYAILPIVNSKNQSLLKKINHALREKDLKDLYFSPKLDEFEAENQDEIKKKNKFFSLYNNYTRLTKSDASIAFANFYGTDQEHILGKQISGDDHHLIQALIKDTSGVSYNNLGFIFNLKTRQNVEGVSIIPIDLNNNKKFDGEEQKIYASLDSIISYLEENESPKLPTENINLVFEKNTKNNELSRFLNWVLSDGQKYNHDYGFLNQKKKYVTKYIDLVNDNLK